MDESRAERNARGFELFWRFAGAEIAKGRAGASEDDPEEKDYGKRAEDFDENGLRGHWEMIAE